MESYDVVDWGKPLQRAVRETPEPTGTEVLVRVTYCGVCHSDVHIRDGYFDLGGGRRFQMSERGMKLPVTLGHEPYGRVVAGGPEAGELPIGEDRLVYPWTGCGQCARCAEGLDNHCMQPRFRGIQAAGGYADHMIVPHPRYLVDATGIDPTVAPILACSGLTTYSATRKLLPCPPDEPLLVIGAGGLGLMAIAMLVAQGHRNILVAEPDEAKWAAARELGATDVFDPRADGARERLLALPGGLRGAVDFVGATETAKLAFDTLRKGGHYVAVGLYGGEMNLSIVPLIQRAITVQGSYVGSLAELEEVVALARDGRLAAIPTATCQLDEVSEVLDRLKAGQVVGRVVAKID